MEIISANKLKEMNSLNKRKFEQLLPEIVKCKFRLSGTPIPI